MIYMVTDSAAPLHGLWFRMPLRPTCGVPLPPEGWLWGFWGFGFSLSF